MTQGADAARLTRREQRSKKAHRRRVRKWLTEGVIVAIIGAASGWATTLLTLGLERTKLQEEIEKIRAEAKKADAETLRIQRSSDDELGKVRAERQKLEEEVRNLRSERVAKRRSQIIKVLTAFNRQAFYAPISSEDPVFMLKAFTQIRSQLQPDEVSYDPEIGDEVRAIQRMLAKTENDVSKRFPKIAKLAASATSTEDLGNARHQHQSQLGMAVFDEAVNLLMAPRGELDQRLKRIESKLPAWDRN